MQCNNYLHFLHAIINNHMMEKKYFVPADSRFQSLQSTHGRKDKMAAISQMAFWNWFSGIKMVLLSKFQRLVPHGPINCIQAAVYQHWSKQWLVTSHYLNQCWLSLMTHIPISRLQWVNQLIMMSYNIFNFRTLFLIYQGSFCACAQPMRDNVINVTL